MNHIFKLLWNSTAQAWVVVAEIAKSCGKAAGSTALLVAVGYAWAGPEAPPPVSQLPTGGVVVAGQAAITQSTGRMDVQQTSARAAIDWANFNVGSQAQVHFQQPSSSSVLLNRVLDTQASQIWGQITANGQVFLSNPNGVYFSPTASVSVGGLVATTHSISNQDFMAGRSTWSRQGALGAVLNDGDLRAALGGYVALLAPEVRNRGTVLAQAGTVAMAAGEKFELQFDGSGSLAKVRVSPAEVQTLVDNGNAVLAPGGLIVLSAQAANQLAGSVVRNTGTLEASGVSQQGGRIFLDGGAHGQVSVTGQVQANSSLGQGGSITVSGEHIHIGGSAHLGASGATGGGEVRVGGSWQGQDLTVRASTSTVVESGALMDANATNQGDGGTVVVWSDINNPQSLTQVGGTLQARGAGTAGEGGRVETSGFRVMTDGGLRVDTRSPSGRNGTWLIDPNNYTIAAAGGDITGTALSANLDTSNVTISTLTQGVPGSGDILVNEALNWSGTNMLTLSAERNIAINADITASGNGAGIQLFYGGSNTTTAPVASTGYTLGTGANITLSGTTPVVWIGNNQYTALKTLTNFSAMNNSNGKFVLVNDIDASVSGTKSGPWVGQLGSGTGSVAVFDGFGNTISNMSISSTFSYQGLIGYNYGTVRNLGVQNFTLLSPGADQSLGLIGLNSKGSVSGIAVSGANSVACSYQCGTIIGWNDGGTLNNFTLAGTIALSGSSVGGAVGRNTTNAGVTGTVSNGVSSAAVSSTDTGYFTMGGVVGGNSGDVSAVSNSGTVTVNGARTGSVDTRFGSGIGGLIGENGNGTGAGQTAGLLSNSSFTGSVTVGSGTSLATGFWGVGGLVGYNHTSIQGSTSSGTVTAGDFAQYVGGLAGNSSNVYSNSAVTAISTSTSTGNVSTGLSAQFVGGISGATPNYSTLTTVTSRGNVSTGTGSTYIGGITGYLAGTGTSLTNSASSSVVSVGGVAPVANYGVSSTYRGFLIGYNTGSPSSTFAQTPITVSTVPLTITFGNAPVYSYALVSGVLTGGDTLPGILTGSANCVACTNVGVYAVTAGTVASSNSYYLTWQNGSLTVNPFALTAIAGSLTGSLSKTYDGSTSVTLGPSNYVLTGFIGGDNANITKTSGNFNDANAGSGKNITVSLSNTDYTAVGATNLSNYILPTSISGNIGTITPVALTVTANSTSKTYDGVAFAGGNGVTYNGFVAGESSAVLGGTLAYGGSSQGAKNVGNYSINPSGLNSGNYNISYSAGGLSISPAGLSALAIGLTGVSTKPYDGTTQATLAPGNYLLSGFAAGEGASITQTLGTYASPGAGTNKTITVALAPSDYAASGGTVLSNYTLPSTVSGSIGTITPAALTVTANSASKTYDGVAFAGGNGVTYNGFVAGESSAVLSGTLAYGGSSQGAITEGNYALIAQGLSSSNYTLSYSGATLVVKPAPFVPTAVPPTITTPAPPVVNPAPPLEPPLVFATPIAALVAAPSNPPTVPPASPPATTTSLATPNIALAIPAPETNKPTAPTPAGNPIAAQTVDAPTPVRQQDAPLPSSGRSVLRMEDLALPSSAALVALPELQTELSQLQQGIAGSAPTGEALDALTSSLIRSASSQGLSPEQTRSAVKAFDTALGVLLANGMPLDDAVLRAQGSFAAERDFPLPSLSPQATALSALVMGTDADTQLTTLAQAQSSRGLSAFDKTLGVTLAKGLSVNEALRLAQQAAKLADQSIQLDQSPMASLSNSQADTSAAFADTSPAFQQTLGALLSKGVPLAQALNQADGASKAFAAAAQADKRVPAAALASGDASFIEGFSLDGAFAKVLGNSLARGVGVAQAFDKAQSAGLAEQQGKQADARNDLAGFSSGGANLPQGSQDFDRALANALNRGDAPTRALAVARKAIEKMPAEVRSASTALASGQDVDSLLASPGNSRAFKLALGNALSRGMSVEQALKLATKAELASAFRFPLTGLAARLIDVKNVKTSFSLEDGKPLPPWLRFAPELKSLLIADAPDGALPMNVVVSAGKQTARITVSEGRSR
ncbi:MAG: hypothetical protein CFE43_11980 [Burkholderiales bacterium PBB3]|nr:MAG: hypothetical protein CFE43_11980 [Burkholderiales bacterium PBB3]